MALKLPRLLLLDDIPKEDFSLVAANSQRRPNAWPAHGSYGVIGQLTKPGHFRTLSIPKINRIAQPHGQKIVLGPTHQVEIEIVGKGRGIQYFAWMFVDLASLGIIVTQFTDRVEELAPLLRIAVVEFEL